MAEEMVDRAVRQSRTMFAKSEGVLAAAEKPFRPAQRLKVAVKLAAEYAVPVNAPEAAGGEVKDAAAVAAAASVADADGEDDTAQVVRELAQRQKDALAAAPLGSTSGGGAFDPASTALALVDPAAAKTGGSRKRPGSSALALLEAVGENTHAATTLAKRRRAAQVPEPEWHAPWKLMRVLSGHLGWVRSVAVDPTNEWFATGSADRTIKIWDLASGQLRLTLTGHIHTVRGLCISHRHPYLFSAGEDKMVKCWDLEYNRVIRHYHGHLSGVYCIAQHPLLDVIITAGRDSVARVWDMRTKAQAMVLGGHENTIASIIAQDAEPQIITGSHDTTMRLWDLRNGDRAKSTLTNHKKAVGTFFLILIFYPGHILCESLLTG